MKAAAAQLSILQVESEISTFPVVDSVDFSISNTNTGSFFSKSFRGTYCRFSFIYLT